MKPNLSWLAEHLACYGELKLDPELLIGVNNDHTDTLSTQLNDQLFSAMIAVPIASRTEGVRQALGQINAAFTSA